MSGGDRQAVCLRKVYDRLVVLLRRPETCSEFRGREKSMKIGAVRIVKLLKQFYQLCLVPQWQTDSERKIIGRRQTTFRRQPCHCRRHMTGQAFPAWFRAENTGRGGEKNCRSQQPAQFGQNSG